LQTVIEDIALPNPVVRSHYGNGFIKQYVRDHLLLRTEPARGAHTKTRAPRMTEEEPHAKAQRRKGMDELETVKIDSRRMGTTESVYNATKAQTAHPFFLRIFASLLLCVRSFSVILGAGAFA
jgi:hypothetical protein